MAYVRIAKTGAWHLQDGKRWRTACGEYAPREHNDWREAWLPVYAWVEKSIEPQEPLCRRCQRSRKYSGKDTPCED